MSGTTRSSSTNASSLSGVVMLAGSGAAGVTVKLVNASGTVVGTSTTDSTGAFTFTGFAAGSYQVQYVAPKGDVLETGSEATATTGLTPVVAVAAGQSVALPAETLLSNPATIDGMIYRYGTGDPSWGAGAAGVVVTLLNSAGVAVATTTTTTGWFAFTGLAAGTYQLKYAPPAGEVIQSGSSANPATGLTAAVTVTAGQTLAVANGAVVPTGSLSGEVTLAGAGKAGVTVALLNASGTTIATTTTTGSTGAFTFSALIAGSYQLKYTAPTGDALSTTSAASTTTGLTPVISLSAGQALSLAPEVLTGPTSIAGNVVYQGAGEAGVAVALLNSAGTTVATTTTTATGTFLFTGLTAGSYRVRYTAPTEEVLQAGSLADVTTGMSAAISLVANQAVTLSAETLVDTPATIDGTVVYKGAGERGVAVELLNTAGTEVAATTTNSAGFFTFSGVAVGSYQLLYTAPTGEALAASGPANLLSGLTASVAIKAGQTLHMSTETMVASRDNIGVYVGYPGTSTYNATLSQYAATVGAAPGYADTFIDDSQAVSQWVHGSQAEAAELRASTDGKIVIPVVSVPLISTVSDGLTEVQNFAAITSGADDSVWLGIVQAYEAQGYTTIDLRIGEEQNGNWYPWSISTTAQAQAYISAFDHISALVHNVAGITVNVIWNPSTVTTSAIPTDATYPGNAYVDMIGVDAYDFVAPLTLYDWSTHTVDATLAQWEANPVNLEHYWTYPDATASSPTGTGQGFGLADAIALAKSTGKPLALPEVGAGGASISAATDDALFPQYLATTLLSSGVQIAFANIWDSGTYTFSDGSKPNEAAAWANFVKEMNQGDAGPSASPGSTSVGHSQTVNLGSQVAALIIAGKTGDTETITAVSASLGTATLGSGGAITYVAPASGTSTLTYTVTDQLGDKASFTDTIAIDPGPTGGGGSITAGHGQKIALTSQILALVKPGLTGDTETITAITSTLGAVSLGAGGVVTYTAPASGTGTLTYTVTDQLGDKASFTSAIVVDPGPTLAVGSTSVVQGTTAALGTAIAALIKPGLTGDTETITAVSAAKGTATLGANGAISYTAPSTTGSDTLTYTVTDQYGDTSTGSYAVSVIPTPATISGDTFLLGPAYPSWGVAQSGVTVSLINAAGAVVATTVSANGYYAFQAVSPGTYQLQFTPAAGEVVSPSGIANVTTGLTAAFTLTPGQSYAAPNANFVQAAVVTGTVLLAGAGLSGVTVSLINSAGSVAATTTTSNTGAFTFNSLQAGSYQVQYTPPTHDALVAGGPASIVTDLTAPVTLTAGQTVTLAAETMAVATTAILSGSVIYAGAGQAGVAVSLLNSAGKVVATTTTSSTGSFAFTGIAPGSYKVQYTPPAGEALPTTSTATTNAATSASPSITLTAGQNVILAAETLVALPATIDGSVLHFGATTDPTSGSGQAGVAVALLNAAGTVLATTLSNASGAFDFTGVAPGTYTLDYTLPSGQNFESGSGVSLSTGLSSPFTVAAGATVSTPSVAVESTINTAALHLTFDDEFNSFVSSPNGSAGWMTAYPFGGENARTLVPNHEAEYYSDPSVGENPFSVSNGVLSITATPAAAGSNPYGLPYDSGVATTYKSFAQLYGYFEVKAELPAGPGLWPAFWLLPADNVNTAELDVFEVLGNAAATIYETTHGSNTDGSNAGQQQIINGTNTSTGFHTYGVDWEPNTITFYIDGQAVATDPTPASMDKPMYMLLDLAVGGTGSWPGATNSSTQFPAAMQIDYVRAYATANTVDVSGTDALGTVTGNVTLANAGTPGVAVSLLTTSGVVIATTTTDSTGSFTFNSVAAGSYQVQYAAPVNDALQAGGPASPSTGLTSAITLTAGQTLTLATETLAAVRATLSGSVVYAGAAQAGIAIALLNSAGTAVTTTTTSSTGTFTFNSVAPGAYQVKYTAPANEMLQAGGLTKTATSLTSAVTLAAGQVLTLATETLAPAFATLSGSVTYSTAGQAGVAIALLNSAGTAVATTTTSNTGAFTFNSVAVGSYQLQYIAPAGEAPNATGPANTVTGLTSAITLSAGQVLNVGVETLIPAFGTVMGKVYHLGSADPSWGSPQSGVSVALVNAAGTTVATTVSDKDGWFDFANMADGTYSYIYTLPAGEAFQAGGPVNAATGASTPFVITAGSSQFTPTVDVVSSSNSFALNGAGAVALRGPGNYTVTGNASGGTLTLGNGNDSINLTGGGDTITVGAGTSTITALGANNLITAGPGMSFITVDTSAGNKFVTNAAGQGLETISGFTSGDVLDLAHTLAGVSIASNLSNLGSYITAVTNGGNTTLLVNPSGSGTASAFVRLNDVNTTVAGLVNGHNISLI